MITPLPYFNYIRGLLAITFVLISTFFVLANGNKPCKATAAEGDDHAIWLSKYKNGKEANYIFDQQGGSLVENEDGTAHVYGIIYNKKNPNDQWEVQLWLSDRMDWEEWSALGRSYKDERNQAGKLYKTWSYYIMDPAKQSKFVGKGKNEGMEVPLRHNPINYLYAFQVGQAANSKNGNYGLSGWFLYFLNSDEPRPGDFNLDLSCSTSEPAEDCPDCYSSEILNQTTTDEGCTIYTMEVKNDGGCRHGLSHYTVEIPCGDVSDVSNSENWKVEIGKDPTTGINGFKIDNINGFGEAGQPGSFTVEFKVCPDSDCGSVDCKEVQVAHKAGQCITAEALSLCYMSDGGQTGGDGGQTGGDGSQTGGDGGQTGGDGSQIGGDGTDNTSAEDCDVNELAANLMTDDVTCADAQDGSISLKIIGGTAPFTFAWSNGATTQDLSALGGGNYSVTITDANDATLQLSGAVFEPTPLVVSGAVSPLSCGATNGSIVLTVSGGTSPYTYSWSNGSTDKDLNGLMAGGYSVTVTDANGCSISEDFTLLATSDMSAAISTNSCSDGFLTLDVLGGVPPYSYQWSSGETTKDIKVGATGTYNVTVTDVNGCSTSTSIDVNNLTLLDLSLLETTPSCAGNSDGAMDLTVSGGQAPYSYSWSLAGTQIATTEDLSGVASGNYTVTVTDANGCMNELTHFLRNPVSIFISDKVTLIRCDGNGDDGAIDVSIFNAGTDYTTIWTKDGTPFSTSEDLANLESGLYGLTVTAANGCKATKTIELVAPEDFQVDLTQQYCGDGKICPTIAGGNGQLSYQWTGPNGAISTIDGCIQATEAGDYTVLVTDASGCTKSATINIGTPNPSLNASVSVTDPTCAGASNGSATVSVSGGDGNYTILWSTGANTQSISDLAAGTYTVRVNDSNDCQQFLAFSVKDPQGPEISASTITEVSCNGLSDGAIDITVSNGAAPYGYSWSNGAASEDLAAVGVGNYDVTVTDANGCSVMMSFEVVADPDNTGCDSGNGDGGNGDGGDGNGDGSGDGNGDGTATDCIRDCNECDGNVTQLTLKYIGDDSNAQITVKQGNGGQVVFDQVVAPEAEFSFMGTDTKGTLTSEIIISVNGVNATTIHTSCSQPIGPGLIAGDFEVVEGESRNGGLLCPIETGAEQEQQVVEEQEVVEPQGQDCAESHETQLIAISETEAGCVTYTLEVTNNGAGAHGLSHYSIRVPCGIVTDASNSRGWKMELNGKDPATGLYGLKVDDISGFGEDGQGGSFTVTYTVCSNQDESCDKELKSADIIVGYKAGQCAKIETVMLNDQVASLKLPTEEAPLTFVRFSVFPNPVEVNGATGLKLEFHEANIGEELNVKLVGVAGNVIYSKNIKISMANEVLPLQTAGLKPGIYLVTVTSHHKVYSEKVIFK